MTLSDIQTIAQMNRVSITVESGKIVLDGPDDAINELIPLVKSWKPELIQLLGGDSITNVGQCEHCIADLIGLPVSFDGYVNRVCGACGHWAVCLPSDWSPEHIRDGETMIVCPGGTYRGKFEQQKSIFDVADRRQSGKTDDRNNPK